MICNARIYTFLTLTIKRKMTIKYSFKILFLIKLTSFFSFKRANNNYKAHELTIIDQSPIAFTGKGGLSQLATFAQNGTSSNHSGILRIGSSNGQVRKPAVAAPPVTYPSYNVSPKVPDSTGMRSNAVQL